MSAPVISQVLPFVRLGEGPHWVEADQSLLFVDIDGGDLHRYFPDTKRHQVLHVEEGDSGGSVSFVIPVEGAPDLFVIGLGRSLAVVQWSTTDPDRHTVRAKAFLHTVDNHTPTNRLNDGKCDPQGRLWTGTMGYDTVPAQPDLHKGSLYGLDDQLRLTHWADKISLSNGLAWSADKKTFYYIDSLTYRVDAFDYEDATGKICNRRPVIDYKSSGLTKDMPDGMCIDAEGNLWVASFFGKKVTRIDPRLGKIINTIEMPAQNVTSVCWGGSDYSTLFATSARIALDSPQSADGGVFAITGLGVKGLPPVNFKAKMDLLRARMVE